MLSRFSMVILAAGRASRMGYPKGLIRSNDRTLLESHIDSFLSCNGRHVHLVFGENQSVYEESLPRLFHHSRIDVIINDKVELGPFYSLQLGLQELPERESRFVLPVDAQTPASSTWALLAQSASPGLLAVIPTHKNKGGHPVVISHDYSKLLLALDPKDEKARLDLQNHLLKPDRVKWVEIGDAGVLANYNSPGDLSPCRRRGESRALAPIAHLDCLSVQQ